MVVLDASLKRIRELVGDDSLSVEKLGEDLFNFGMELESVEGDNLKIDITHDRPDLMSVQGLARALRYYLGKQRGLPKYKVEKSDVKFYVKKSVKNVRPYALGCIIKGIEFSDDFIKEMIWVQEKIHATIGRDRKKAAIGIYPLDKIRTPITYSAENPKAIRFVPLGFDEEMNAIEILKKHPTGEKYAHLLEEMQNYPCIRDAKGSILSMPPIINSQLTGKVSEETKDVFIEVTGTHLKTISEVLTILATMFGEAGATINVIKTVFEDGETLTTPNLEPERMKLSIRNVNELIGIELKKDSIKKLLERMGHEVESIRNDVVEVLVPAYRTDLWHEVDLIDDIARAYGFGNVGSELPNVSTTGDLLKRTRFVNSIRDMMVGLGFLESFTFALTTESEQYEKMQIREERRVTIQSSKAPVTMLRTWLLPELLKCLEQNLHKHYPINLFEASDVVLLDEKSDVKSRNETRLSCISCSSETDFTRMRSVLDALMRALGLDYELKKSGHKSFVKGRAGDIYINKNNVGIIGELHPQVIKNFGAELPITALELNVEELMRS